MSFQLLHKQSLGELFEEIISKHVKSYLMNEIKFKTICQIK
jgi:hypothetical protein